MRLLNTTIEVERFIRNMPPYAILSHWWEDDEVTLEDMKVGRNSKGMEGCRKLRLSCAGCSTRSQIYLDRHMLHRQNGQRRVVWGYQFYASILQRGRSLLYVSLRRRCGEDSRRRCRAPRGILRLEHLVHTRMDPAGADCTRENTLLQQGMGFPRLERRPKRSPCTNYQGTGVSSSWGGPDWWTGVKKDVLDLLTADGRPWGHGVLSAWIVWSEYPAFVRRGQRKRLFKASRSNSQNLRRQLHLPMACNRRWSNPGAVLGATCKVTNLLLEVAKCISPVHLDNGNEHSSYVDRSRLRRWVPYDTYRCRQERFYFFQLSFFEDRGERTYGFLLQKMSHSGAHFARVGADVVTKFAYGFWINKLSLPPRILKKWKTRNLNGF